MGEFVRENKAFDFVINDLTDIVIRSEEVNGEYRLSEAMFRLIHSYSKYLERFSLECFLSVESNLHLL